MQWLFGFFLFASFCFIEHLNDCLALFVVPVSCNRLCVHCFFHNVHSVYLFHIGYLFISFGRTSVWPNWVRHVLRHPIHLDPLYRHAVSRCSASARVSPFDERIRDDDTLVSRSEQATAPCSGACGARTPRAPWSAQTAPWDARGPQSLDSWGSAWRAGSCGNWRSGARTGSGSAARARANRCARRWEWCRKNRALARNSRWIGTECRHRCASALPRVAWEVVHYRSSRALWSEIATASCYSLVITLLFFFFSQLYPVTSSHISSHTYSVTHPHTPPLF